MEGWSGERGGYSYIHTHLGEVERAIAEHLCRRAVVEFVLRGARYVGVYRLGVRV